VLKLAQRSFGVLVACSRWLRGAHCVYCDVLDVALELDLFPPGTSKIGRGWFGEGGTWMPQGLRSRVGSRCDVSDVQPPSHFPTPALPRVTSVIIRIEMQLIMVES